jgi:integrase
MREQGFTFRQIAGNLGLAVSTACRLAGLSLDASRQSPRRAIVATLALAGLRAGELCKLRWREVDLAHRVLHVPGTKTDSAARDVKLLDRLREELMRWKRASTSTALDDLVFPTATGRGRDTGNLRQRVLAPAIREADCDRRERGLLPLPSGLTPHSLRRTFISLLLASGRPLPNVQRQAGHSDAHTTLNIYAQIIDTDFGAKERLEWLCEYSTQDEDASGDLAGTGASPVPGSRDG